jgi:hypothetical protein
MQCPRHFCFLKSVKNDYFAMFRIKVKTMKYFMIFFGLLIGLVHTAAGQDTLSIGVFSGSGSTNVLLSTSTTVNRYSRTISLYSAYEVSSAGGSAGSITSLGWDKSGTGEYTSNDAYIKVLLKNVPDTAWAGVPLWDSVALGATEVFTSSVYSIPTGTGWKHVPFTTPFVWDGSSAIAVMVEWDRASAPTGAINWGRSTTTSANATRVGSTSLAALALLINNNRPLVQFVTNSSPPVAITAVQTGTQGNVPASITTNAGTLQLTANVLPANANQGVRWSLTPGTGNATISPTGLVTAIANGSVWAKATSLQDTTISDSLQITITNQIVIITSVVVNTQGGIPAQINVPSGTLQLEAAVLPVAANQAVNWSVIAGSGTAQVDGNGLLTALSNGTVSVRAAAQADTSIFGSLEVTITNQQSSVSEQFAKALKIYPNPVTAGQLTVSVDASQWNEVAEVLVYDLAGRQVHAASMTADRISLDLGHLSQGTYRLTVKATERRADRMFVVQ